jgi:hypothetical protein
VIKKAALGCSGQLILKRKIKRRNEGGWREAIRMGKHGCHTFCVKHVKRKPLWVQSMFCGH